MPMKKTVPPLSVIDAESLSDKILPAQEDVVENLLPPGLTILGGAAKVGKSWLTLDLCNRIANGEEFLGNPVRRGSTLYLCLEDTERRLQNRINTITNDPSSVNFLSLEALSLGDGLCDQVRTFAKTRPDLVLVVIDTLQLIRGSDADPSYANDYQDIRLLKALADELGISIVAVHHLRKQKDDDPLNTLSGTTGLSGAADAVLILQKVRRGSDIAKLICTGRDIEYRELTLQLNKHCVWEVEDDSKEESALLLPEELRSLVGFLHQGQGIICQYMEGAVQLLLKLGLMALEPGLIVVHLQVEEKVKGLFKKTGEHEAPPCLCSIIISGTS